MGDLNNDIERYLRGEMTPAEMHALEKKALSDPFLADALEGASTMKTEEFFAGLNDIKKKIQPDKTNRTYTLRIAAGIIVLLSVGLYLLWPSPAPVQLAQQKEKEKEVESQLQQAAVDSAVVDSTMNEVPPSIVEKPKVEKQKAIERDQTTRSLPQAATTLKHDTTTAEPALHAVAPVATHTVAGNVTIAEDGLPLPGVTVLIKGTTQGTTTDLSGNYSIEVPDSSSLVFSFVGMHPTELSVARKTTGDIKMKEDVSQLSEVVIARAPLPKGDNETSDIKLAEPVGGIKAYDKYLEDNKKYPQQALENNVKGRVIVGFDVGIRGELSNFIVIRSLGYGCDDEVIRLIKEGPNWNPTTESTLPVESTIHVKMKFDAPKFKKKR